MFFEHNTIVLRMIWLPVTRAVVGGMEQPQHVEEMRFRPDYLILQERK
jgi:hypothetical protein